MKITRIISQHRRDFTAIYQCEHCENEHRGIGYDDAYFHNEVMPKKKCPACGQTADESYVPRTPKYADDAVV